MELADLANAAAQDDLRSYRAEADSILRRVVGQIQLELGEKQPSYVRRLLRRLGFQFASDPHEKEPQTETPEPVDQAPPPPETREYPSDPTGDTTEPPESKDTGDSAPPRTPLDHHIPEWMKEVLENAARGRP